MPLGCQNLAFSPRPHYILRSYQRAERAVLQQWMSLCCQNLSFSLTKIVLSHQDHDLLYGLFNVQVLEAGNVQTVLYCSSGCLCTVKTLLSLQDHIIFYGLFNVQNMLCCSSGCLCAVKTLASQQDHALLYGLFNVQVLEAGNVQTVLYCSSGCLWNLSRHPGNRDLLYVTELEVGVALCGSCHHGKELQIDTARR
jgi:hypothetical protein